MAIQYGEYGPYDDATGQPVFNAGGESGFNWMTAGNETVPSVPVGLASPALPDSAYIVRGNYRLPNVGLGGSRMGGGQLEVRDASGNWVPVTAATAPAGYDPRQDSSAQGSNERLRFDQAFTNAPEGIPIEQMQQWAIANGWQEPDRSKNEGTLGAMFSNIAPYAALMAGGIGAMGGFGGMLGSANAASLAAGDSMAGLIPAGELGALTGAAGTTAGSSGMGLWDSITNGLSNMFSSGASDIAPNLVGSDAIETMSNVMNATGTTTFGDAASALGYSSPVEMLGSINPSWISDAGSIANLIQKGGQAAKSLLGADGSGAKLLSGALTGIGSMLSGNAATSASKTAADAQIEAAKIAADAAKFRPVGVTTRFGNSGFTKDANGNVIGAGYQLTPDIKAQQDALIGAGNTMLPQFTGSVAATAPMGTAAGRMMTLGNGYLSTDPLAQAKKYYDDQQAILAAGRERDQAGMLTGEFNRGTYGLSTGGTSTGMTASNPRLEAYYNSLRQQDLGLAADATKGGMEYAKFGSGMVGAGGDMLKGMYGVQTASYDPYKTAMGGAQTLEGLGQNSMDMGVNLGKTTSNAASGQLLANGMMAAANTMQPANSYSPWGAMLTGAGNAVQNYTPPAGSTSTYDPSKFRLVPFGS